MQFLDMLSNVSEQLRLSPISTGANIVQWMTQAVKSVCVKSRFLEHYTLIPCKANTARYMLPADHIATLGVFYDGISLEKINAADVEFVSPTTPTYYYEDEWEDEASENKVAEFATHYTLNELWPLQLMRSQQSAGTKTLTLVSAPSVDGVAVSSPIVGVLDGTVDTTALIWSDPVGLVTAALTSQLNLLVFYKRIDTLPVNATTDIAYADLMGLLYNCGTLALALSTEDDEYDRYRSWLYDYITNAMCMSLANIAVNRTYP